MLSAALSASLSSSTSSSLLSMTSSTSMTSLSSLSSASSGRISKRKSAFPIRAPSSLGFEGEDEPIVRAKRCLTVDIRGSGKTKTGILRWDTYDPNALAKQPTFMFSVTEHDGSAKGKSESIIDWFSKVPLVNDRCLGGNLGKRDAKASLSLSQPVGRVLRSGASPPHIASNGGPVPPDTPSSLLPRNTILKMPDSYVPASRRGSSSSAINYPMRLKRTHSSSSLSGNRPTAALQRTVSSDRVRSSTPPSQRTLASLPLRRQPSRCRATTPLPPSTLGATPPSLPNIALLPAVNIESPQPTSYSTTSQHSQLSAATLSDAETEEAVEEEEDEEEYRPKRKRAAPASARASPSPPSTSAATANAAPAVPVKRPRGRPPKNRASLAVSASEYDSEASSVSNTSRAGTRSSKRRASAAGMTRATSKSPPAAVILLAPTQARKPSVAVAAPPALPMMGSAIPLRRIDDASPLQLEEINPIAAINTTINKEPNYTTLPSPVPLQAVALNDTIPRSSPLTQNFPSSVPTSTDKDIPVPHSDSPGTLFAQIKLAVEASK